MSGRFEFGGSVPATLSERLTSEFYAWEIRGRGWNRWGVPVELEPPFRPFFFHTQPSQSIVDDGRKPTFLSNLVRKLSGRSSDSSLELMVQPGSEPDVIEPDPEVITEVRTIVEFQLVSPASLRVDIDVADQFLSAMHYSKFPLSFEVIGSRDQVVVQFASRIDDRSQTSQQLQAYFPDAILIESTDYLSRLWKWDDPSATGIVVDFGLSNEFMRPLKSCKSFDPDPLISIVGAMTRLGADEAGVFQILFQAAQSSWAESIIRSIVGHDGKSFFVDAPELVGLARQKVSLPLYATVIRVAGRSPNHQRAWEIARAIGAGLAQFSEPLSNELIPLDDEGYDPLSHSRDLVHRLSRRSGMLLNREELLALVHPPSASVRAQKLKRQDKRSKPAPKIALGHSLVLGDNVHAGKTSVVTLDAEQRVRHMYVIGVSGTGKSTLLLNLILQDIRNGDGIAVLDPHGDLIDKILPHIPEERLGDVVLVDPADDEFPVGFNIISAHSELEKNLLASDLASVFRRLSTSWGDQMNSVLSNAILAFLESERGGTLMDLRRFLVEPDFRKEFLTTVRDQEVVYYWKKEFPLLAGKPQAPLLTRLNTFLRIRRIRYMVAQKENRLDFAAMMNTGKIFLAKLAQGTIGEENAYLLGTLLVGKFQQIAMSRQELAESARRHFYLYIDEFHNFATPSMAGILSGARKYHLGLILAHQELKQLAKEPELASAVISNPHTRICFRLGDQDASKLAKGFSSYDAKDLQSLGRGEAICRIERAEYDFNLKTTAVPAVSPEAAQRRRDQIIARSRATYGTKREDLEAQFARPSESLAVPDEEVRHEPIPPVAKPITRSKREESATPAPAVHISIPEPGIEPPITVDHPQPLLGRGGAQHKYLQQLVKRWGEEKGYRCTIEKPILNGVGSIDVALEREGSSIACEISITSTPHQEVSNIQKCIAAGCQWIVVISTDKRTLEKTRELLDVAVSGADAERVRLFSPEEFMLFLEEIEGHAPRTEDTVRGYRVKLKYKAVPEKEQKSRKQAIAQTIARAMKRLKGKS